MSDFERVLSVSFKVNFSDTFGLSTGYFLLVFKNNIWPMALQDISFQNLSDPSLTFQCH